MARVFNVEDVVNCPFRGGDREGCRKCEAANCMAWEWSVEDVSGFCSMGYVPAAVESGGDA